MRDELVGIYQVGTGEKFAVVTVDGGYRVLGLGIMSVVMDAEEVERIIEVKNYRKVA